MTVTSSYIRGYNCIQVIASCCIQSYDFKLNPKLLFHDTSEAITSGDIQSYNLRLYPRLYLKLWKIRYKISGKKQNQKAKLKGEIKQNVLLSNVNRMHNGVDELHVEALLANKQLKNFCTLLLTVTETWINSNITDIQLSLPGHTPLRADRGNVWTKMSPEGGL